MAVQVTIPTVFRQYTSGEKYVHAQGGTVADVLEDLRLKHPALQAKLCSEDGELRRFVNLYVNDVDVRESGLMQTRTADGDSLIILPAVAGG